MTAAQFEDQEGRALVEAIHARKAPCQCGHGQCVHCQDGCVDKSGGGYFCECMGYEPPAFDYDAPLPPMPDYRARSWEPAARHYRDLDDNERTDHTTGTGTL